MLEATQRTFDIRAATVDYVVDLPAGAGVNARSTSGMIEIEGIAGPTVIQTTSGAVRLDAVTGDLRVNTTSGDVRGTGVDRPRDVTTTSGSVDLSTGLQSDARLTTSSGDVRLRLDDGASARIAIDTSSGTIRTPGLPLGMERRDTRSVAGTLGGGQVHLDAHTSSGDITLSR
jgi:DUF4097 and DUF4098 domain-containing protein YvlB